jgi:carbohydrate-selective porin OprB
LEVTYSFAGGQLPGTFAVGAFYEASGEIDGQPISAVHEYIVQFEQVLYREDACRHSEQGLSIFCGYYPRFPGDRKIDESIGDSLVAGLVYRGPVPGRDRDSMGIGFARAELFRGGTNKESIFELYYRFEATPRLSIQPDLQYISTPSGILRDALAVGVRVQLHW